MQESLSNFSPSLLLQVKSLLTEIQECKENVALLSQSICGTKLGDEWVQTSLKEILVRLTALENEILSDNFLFSGFRKPHPAKFDEVIQGTTEVCEMVSEQVCNWRQNTAQSCSTALPWELKKGVFDYYFKYDLYGKFKHDDTLILSSGSKELPFFSPPAGVRLALDVANRNTWFGYSDSLGHIEAREAVALVESLRRTDGNITADNVALVQGGTHGLHVVMGLLKKNGLKGKIVCVLPTYAPLLDDIAHHFEVLPVLLDQSYQLDWSALAESLKCEDVCGAVLCVPHNPPLARDASSQEIARLATICSELGKYLIIDEVVFCEEISNFYCPEKYPTTIVIHSYSKRYGIPGLKIGHLLATKNFIAGLYRYASSSYGSPPSFLYLVCTTINALQAHQQSNDLNLFNQCISEVISNPAMLVAEYKLWWKCETLFERTIEHLISRFTELRFAPSISGIHPAETGSANRVVSTQLQQTSYRVFLEILARKNVSVFPLDCMIPADARRDFRITVTVQPSNLVHGLTAASEVTDELLAREKISEWLHVDDAAWLNSAGLYSVYPNYHWLGHVFRVVCRLKQILALENVPLPPLLLRAACLHDLGKVWTMLDVETRREQWKNLTGTILREEIWTETDDRVWSFDLLRYAASTPGLPSLPPELQALLEDYLSGSSNAATKAWIDLIDIADKTSDFIQGPSVNWDQLEMALNLKERQVTKRYPALADKFKHEYAASRAVLRGLAQTLRNALEDEKCITQTSLY